MKRSAILGGLVAISVVLSLPAALVVGIAEWFPASWFIELQARWNDGYYYQKLTFLLTWFAILVAITMPLQIVGGAVQLVRGLFRRAAPLSRASRAVALRARLARVLGGGALGGVSLLLLATCAIRPDVLDPLGFLAALLLLLAIVGPALGLMFALDGLCALEVIEGPVERRFVYETPKGGPIHKISVEGRELGVPYDVWQAAAEGTRVRLALTGYLGAFLAIERPERLGELDM